MEGWAGGRDVTPPVPGVRRRRARRRRGRHVRIECMGDLQARYAKYSVRIHELMARKGKKWKRIERVRSKQRRCAVAMLAAPPELQTRAMRRVSAYVNARELERFEACERTSQVYVHFHPEVKHTY